MSFVLSHPLTDPATAARRWRHHLVWLLVALAVLAIALVCRVPDSKVTLPGVTTPMPELCLSRRLLGRDCPGCGMTRCFVALAHGEVSRAWRFNPAGLLWFGVLLWQIPYRAVQLHLLRMGRELIVRRGVGEGVILILMLACIVQWLVKQAGLLF